MTTKEFNQIYLKMSKENQKLWGDIAEKTSVFNPERNYWLNYYQEHLKMIELYDSSKVQKNVEPVQISPQKNVIRTP